MIKEVITGQFCMAMTKIGGLKRILLYSKIENRKLDINWRLDHYIKIEITEEEKQKELNKSWYCPMWFELMAEPVTTPCQHSFWFIWFCDKPPGVLEDWNIIIKLFHFNKTLRSK